MRRLLIFAKYPRAGEVKRRLVPPLTYQQAAELYRAFVADAMDGYREIGGGIESMVYVGGEGERVKERKAGESFAPPPFVDRVFAGAGGWGPAGNAATGAVLLVRTHPLTPSQEGEQEAVDQMPAPVRGWGGDTPAGTHESSNYPQGPGPFKEGELRAQRGNGLGERMENAFREAFEEGCETVCIVGTDLPTLPVEYVRQAFRAMEDHDVAIGPAEDGGYYLLGMKRLHASLFRDLEFSTPTVFKQTMRRAERDGLSVAVLPTWYDVDDEASLRRLWEDRGMLKEGSRTRQVLDAIAGSIRQKKDPGQAGMTTRW